MERLACSSSWSYGKSATIVPPSLYKPSGRMVDIAYAVALASPGRPY